MRRKGFDLGSFLVGVGAGVCAVIIIIVIGGFLR